MTRFRITSFVLAIILFGGLPGIAVPQESQPQQAKVQQLIDLLNDPEIRSLLATKSPDPAPVASAAPAVPVEPATPSLVANIEGLDAVVRDRFTSLEQTIPRIPEEMARAAQIVARDINAGRPGTVIVILAVLVAIGLFGETLVRRLLSRSRGMNDWAETPAPSVVLLGEALPLLVFVGLSVGAFLSFDWPPLLRRVVVTYLAAFIAFRAVTAVARVLVMFDREAASSLPEPDEAIPVDDRQRRFRYRRTRLFLGCFLFSWATVNLLTKIGFSTDAARLFAYVFGLGLLAIAVEAVWRRPRPAGRRAPARDALLTIYLGLLWLVWIAGFYGLLWLGIYTIILPPILKVTGRAAASFARRRTNEGLMAAVIDVLFVRGVRALVIALAIGWIAYVWRFSISAQLSSERYEAVVDGILQGLVILLVADVLWQICKAIIERQVQTSDATISAAEAARKSRLRTVLPLFRNTLAVFIAVVTVLTVLSGLGVAIGPLIAGAGIFGVAIGFGSQTLVKDILSGVFFMLDDAFRVGEYIQSGSYKGTVESFSLRSVRLRHHRGPIFTVPFGDLGAVQNMSRDWVIDKMTINVTYDTDVYLARKLIKKVGEELAADPEFAAVTIEPLKMQGVESFGDFAIVLRMKLMTKPGEQFRIKRKAFVMIKKAFDENGVRIATPTVQVSGDEKGPGPAASEAMRMRRNSEAQALVVE